MLKSLLVSFAALSLTPLAIAGPVQVSFSEDMTEKLEEDYGMREAETLEKRVVEKLERKLGEDISKFSKISVVVEDAKPNRPTFEQLGANGLSMRSISIGGADLTAELFDTSGELVATVEYDWYSMDIRDAIGSATWTDARRAIDRFSKRVKDKAELVG